MIRRPGAVLALLTGLNLLNYLDRFVVSAVLPKIQEDLHLSNFQGGLLATVFLLGYFVTSPIFGSLGDRLPRKNLIAIGVLVWSAATILSGLATGFWSLVLARIVVGVGEASYATLAPTIIDDVTPKDRQGRALATFYVAMPVGSAFGFLVGGFVGHRWGWQNAFFVAGGPGLVLALVCLLLAEPERTVSRDKPNIRRDIRKLASIPLYRKAVLGYSAYTAAIGAFSFWAPKFLYARYAMKLDAANFQFGIVTVLGGAIGTFVGGRWADRATAKAVSPSDSAETSVRARVMSLLHVCAVGSALGAPFALGAFLSPTQTLFFGCAFLAITVLFLNTSPINGAILQAVPTELRASAMALSIFAIHALGDVWSPAFVGLLADHMPMATAMLFLPFAIAVSAGLWWASRSSASAGST